MTRSSAAPSAASPVSTRLSSLARLTADEHRELQAGEANQRRSAARRELVIEHEPIVERRGLVAGWAIRQRILRDGRRQVLSFLLPGDLIGVCQHTSPVAATTIAAVSEVITCAVPASTPGGGLWEAYARSAALEEYCFLAQITRLGQFDARERVADWLLETRERLDRVGLATADQFMLPLTQEMLADALGLTSVHVNRTLQAMRRDGLMGLKGGTVSFPDRARLERLVDYKPVRVTCDGD